MTFDDDYYTSDELGYFHNMVLKGNSGKYITAHYDVRNLESDNANDNSCSVINALVAKVLYPDLNVIMLDGEELGFIGTHYQKLYMWKVDYGKVDYILNLELTGIGAKNICISDYGGCLQDKIKENFNPIIMKLPLNDARYFWKAGHDSVCLSTYPIIDGIPKFEHFKRIHKIEDSLDSISISDMKAFVFDVLLPLIRLN